MINRILAAFLFLVVTQSHADYVDDDVYQVNILIDDPVSWHADLIKKVLEGDMVPRNSGKEKLINNHNIKISNTFESDKEYDIVNMSYSMHHSSASYKPELRHNTPLIVTSAGNASTMCSTSNYNLAFLTKGLSAYNLFQYYGCDSETYNDGSCADKNKIASAYKSCDMATANMIVQDNYGDNIIVVGGDFGGGNKPGDVLKNNWISAPYVFSLNGEEHQGTSYGTPYVVRLAAEIKKRAPHYSNKEIAELIFSTADDIGEDGVDDVYGHGVVNTNNALEELANRGY